MNEDRHIHGLGSDIGVAVVVAGNGAVRERTQERTEETHINIGITRPQEPAIERKTDASLH
jgi:hypothetical protein